WVTWPTRVVFPTCRGPATTWMNRRGSWRRWESRAAWGRRKSIYDLLSTLSKFTQGTEQIASLPIPERKVYHPHREAREVMEGHGAPDSAVRFRGRRLVRGGRQGSGSRARPWDGDRRPHPRGAAGRRG